jgi:hypothetical protein
LSEKYDDTNDQAAYAARQQLGQDGEQELPYVDPHADLEDDQVRANKARLQAEIDKASSGRISPDAPGYDLLLKSRNKHVAATRKMYDVAVGEVPEDFIEPDKTQPAYTKPKPATGFAVVSKGRKRPAATPAPATDPAPAAASAKLVPQLWQSAYLLWDSK